MKTPDPKPIARSGMKRSNRDLRWQRSGAAFALICVWACTPSLRGVGTWSHGMANVKLNGLYGPASGYGAMNSCSLVCTMSLILAQKCGIHRKEVDDAVTRSLDFYRWYVDKGTVPYGDHAPAEYHDNNGKNSMTAVMFDLAGDKEAADFFTRMTLASYGQRELGHTGNFFSWQWGALGAARGGPEAAQSFVRNTRWFTELERRPDGGSVYQNQLASSEHGKYKNWSTTGSRLLQHCLPRYVSIQTTHVPGLTSIAPYIEEFEKNRRQDVQVIPVNHQSRPSPALSRFALSPDTHRPPKLLHPAFPRISPLPTSPSNQNQSNQTNEEQTNEEQTNEEQTDEEQTDEEQTDEEQNPNPSHSRADADRNQPCPRRDSA